MHVLNEIGLLSSGFVILFQVLFQIIHLCFRLTFILCNIPNDWDKLWLLSTSELLFWWALFFLLIFDLLNLCFSYPSFLLKII